MNEEYNKPLDERTKASMTAEEWHRLAAKLIKEETDRHFKNQEKGLRDHFAGLAMQGMLTNDQCDPYAGYFDADIAYQIADAMLKAREE